MSSFVSEAGMPTEQLGKLILSYATGQSLHIPIITKISTPYLAGSTPRMYFGTCLTNYTCEGFLLLTNPTDVPARWTVTHLPGEGAWRRSTAIRVRGFSSTNNNDSSGNSNDVDDPDVFEITPNAGLVEGPTVSVTAAVAAPPVDFNRRYFSQTIYFFYSFPYLSYLIFFYSFDTIVPQRVVKSTWATNTLNLEDSLKMRYNGKLNNEADACYPMPLKIKFSPNKNKSYSSRFRFTCEFANSFDIVLQGQGTYEEHEHKPINPIPK